MNPLIVVTGLPIWISEFLLRSAANRQDQKIYIASCIYLSGSLGIVVWYHLTGLFPWYGAVSISPQEIPPMLDYAVMMLSVLAIAVGMAAFGIALLVQNTVSQTSGHNNQINQGQG